MVLVGFACIAAAITAGCGSESPSGSPEENPKPRPAVAAHAVEGDRFLGLPAISTATVRTDPGELSADVFGLYADPEKAIADLRRDGFVAGIGKTFKAEGAGPDGASHIVVQMRDAQGAAAELERQVEGLRKQPCPPDLECEQETRRFDVPGIPGAAGVNTKLTIRKQIGTRHPDVLRADAIVVRDDTFVEQVFLGTEQPSEHRGALIKAAQGLYQRGKTS